MKLLIAVVLAGTMGLVAVPGVAQSQTNSPQPPQIFLPGPDGQVIHQLDPNGMPNGAVAQDQVPQDNSANNNADNNNKGDINCFDYPNDPRCLNNLLLGGLALGAAGGIIALIANQHHNAEAAQPVSP